MGKYLSSLRKCLGKYKREQTYVMIDDIMAIAPMEELI